jgi:hypothetical protein
VLTGNPTDDRHVAPSLQHHQALFGLPPALSAHDRGFYSPAAIKACETAGVATLAPWHTTPVDGTAAVGGARNLDTLRVRLAGCMVRRIRQEVLSQLPSRTDTRIPIEMTAEQIDEDDGLTVPIASLLARAKRAR